MSLRRSSGVTSGTSLHPERQVDPGPFNNNWRAAQRFKRLAQGPKAPGACAENNFNYFTYRVEPYRKPRLPSFRAASQDSPPALRIRTDQCYAVRLRYCSGAQ